MVACLLAPAAFARPHKVDAKAAPVIQKTGKKSVVSKTLPGRRKATPAARADAATGSGRHRGAVSRARTEPEHRRDRRDRDDRSHRVDARSSAPRKSAVAEPKLVARAVKPAPPAEEEPEAALPEIHVRHDRKQHFAAPTVAADATVSDPDVEPLAPIPVIAASARKAVKSIGTPVQPPVAKAIAVASVERKPVEKVSAPALDEMVQPVAMPALYTKRGRLIVPPALKGSHEILLHQNEMADRDGLDRIQDDGDLERMRESRLLVAIPSMAGIQTDERLPANRRYCRPWTAQFLTALAKAHYARFHTPLQVNSAVRTVEFQQKLLRTNGNAAPAGGETASPHLTGQAIDLAKHGLSMTEIAWLRGYLLPLVQQGKVDVEEEFQQSCFHISVYKRYVPQPAERRKIAPERRGVATALAVAIP